MSLKVGGGEGADEGPVVSEYTQPSSLYVLVKMAHCKFYGQQFAFVRTVTLLGAF